MSLEISRDAGGGPARSPQTTMRVKKRSGRTEPVDVTKIVRAVDRQCDGLPNVDAVRVATKTIHGLYDGATTLELDQLSIQTAAALVVEEPEYGRLAARLLATTIDKEVKNQGIHAFSQSIAQGHALGLLGDRLLASSRRTRELNDASRPSAIARSVLRPAHRLRPVPAPSPTTRLVIETPQQFFLRIAAALSERCRRRFQLYGLFSSLEYLPSSPTLFNAGTARAALELLFIDSPADALEAVYGAYMDVAMLSKVLGRHRARVPPRALHCSLITSTNGHSTESCRLKTRAPASRR